MMTVAVVGARLGNFRLGFTPAWAQVRATRVAITLAGVDATARGRVGSLTIHDALNDAQNTCALTIAGTAPSVAQALRVTINADTPRLLFTGALDTVDQSYQGQPAQTSWPSTAIDDGAKASARLPFGSWTNVSATTIGIALATLAGMTSVHVQAALPLISVNFDGSEGMDGCLTQIKKLIGGYFFWDDGDLWLFQTLPAGDLPDTLDSTPGRFLHDPPIRASVNTSQVRTRVYGKGHGEAAGAAVAAGESVVPIADATMFNPAGGRAISETQQLAYMGVQLGGGGGLVGPGASPSAALVGTPSAGTGVDVGAHDYAVTFVTAAGESLPGPRVPVTSGLLAAPASAPTIGTPTAGGSVDAGAHDYEVTFVTASGETTPSAVSGSQTATVSAAVTAPSGGATFTPTTGGSLAPAAGGYAYVMTYTTALGETTSGFLGTSGAVAGPNNAMLLSGLVTSGDARVTGRKIYRQYLGVYSLAGTIGNNTATTFTDTLADASLGVAEPATNTTAGTNYQTIPLTALPIGAAGVTSRKLYRRFNGTGTFKFAITIANNTATTATDAGSNASLGAAAPSSNTATMQQVALTGVPIGAAAVTSRNIYRTAVGASQLQFQQTIANNTATTGVLDVTADASLGANVPTVDASGLAQPIGQVNAGNVSLIVAGTGPFAAGGGWALIGNGAQAIRYTGVTGTSLTGIPAAGIGAILATVAWNSSITAAPALTGVTGLVLPLIKGAPVNIWVQRDDLAAQTYMAALAATAAVASVSVAAAAVVTTVAAHGFTSGQTRTITGTTTTPTITGARVVTVLSATTFSVPITTTVGQAGAGGTVGAADGILEHLIVDERRGEASLIALCDADLALFSRPLVTVTYATRDVKTKSGKPITIDLASPSIHETLTIQTVDITEIDVAPGMAPRFSVVASNVRFSLENVLSRLAGGLDGL